MANFDIVFGGGSVDNAVVGDTSTQVQAEDAPRKYLILRNLSTTATVFLAIGATAELNKGIPVYPREFYEITLDNLSSAAINGICEAGKTAIVAIQIGYK